MTTPGSEAQACTALQQAVAQQRQNAAPHTRSLELNYLESLARKLEHQPPKVQRILLPKLAQALQTYQQQTDQSPPSPPNAAALAPTPSSPLGELVRAMAPGTPTADHRDLGTGSGPRVELKSVQNSRNTWSKLSAQRQVAQAMDQAPKNAGPINSHRLVLQSLALMRDISPDYLNRFVSYTDTLLCLEQADLKPKAAPKRATGAGKPSAAAQRLKQQVRNLSKPQGSSSPE